MMQSELPARRCALTETFNHQLLDEGFQRFEMSAGFILAPQGVQVGEVFCNFRKLGSDMDVAARDTAILISLMLQHGVPLERIANAVTRAPDGRPQGLAGTICDRLRDMVRDIAEGGK